jgi:hypothetical protein
MKRAQEIWKRASKGDASEITGIVLKSPEARFEKLSRASEGASRTHPPGSSFGASKRGGGGEVFGNPDIIVIKARDTTSNEIQWNLYT